MSKFYQLNEEEWLKACKDLTPAELKILYLLRARDPFGDKSIKFRVCDLASDLGMNKGTVSRAITALKQKEYIDLEIIEAIATLTTKSKKLPVGNCAGENDNINPEHKYPVEKELRTDNPVVATQLGRSLHNLDDRYTTSAIATQPDTPETFTQQGTDFSKTYKTYKTDQIDPNDRVFEDLSQENLPDPEGNRTIHYSCEFEASGCDDELFDFIIRAAIKRGAKLKNPKAYVKKCLSKNSDEWRSRLERSRSETRAEFDEWRAENAIAQAITAKDLNFARAKIAWLRSQNMSEFADRLIIKFGSVIKECTGARN